MKLAAALAAAVSLAASRKAPDPGDDGLGVDTALVDGGAGDAPPPGARCVASDAGCTTGSPGACGAGTTVCDDAGAPVCRALVTTQACYSGVSATRAKGACRDGVQTCAGALGPC